MNRVDSFPERVSISMDELKKLNKEQFDCLHALRSQGKHQQADFLERIATIINRNLVLENKSFDIPQSSQEYMVTSCSKIQVIKPGLLGGNGCRIHIKNFTEHKITFKSASTQSGSFDTTPSYLIPSGGLPCGGEAKFDIVSSGVKEFLAGFTFAIPLLVGFESAAASVSLSVQVGSHSYTVVMGAMGYMGPHKNRAGVEIRGGELKIGTDKETLHGVEVSGTVPNMEELCRQSHCGKADEFYAFYEDAKSSDPSQGFTVKCSFSDKGNTDFYFEIHPLNKKGDFYRG